MPTARIRIKKVRHHESMEAHSLPVLTFDYLVPATHEVGSGQLGFPWLDPTLIEVFRRNQEHLLAVHPISASFAFNRFSSILPLAKPGCRIKMEFHLGDTETNELLGCYVRGRVLQVLDGPSEHQKILDLRVDLLQVDRNAGPWVTWDLLEARYVLGHSEGHTSARLPVSPPPSP